MRAVFRSSPAEPRLRFRVRTRLRCAGPETARPLTRFPQVSVSQASSLGRLIAWWLNYWTSLTISCFKAATRVGPSLQGNLSRFEARGSKRNVKFFSATPFQLKQTPGARYFLYSKKCNSFSGNFRIKTDTKWKWTFSAPIRCVWQMEIDPNGRVPRSASASRVSTESQVLR